MNDYVEALNHYINTPAKIVSGEGYVFSNGEWISYDEYLNSVSRPTFQYPAKDNADKKNITPDIIVKKST